MNNAKLHSIYSLVIFSFLTFTLPGFSNRAMAQDSRMHPVLFDLHTVLFPSHKSDDLGMYRVTPVRNKYERTDVLSAGADIITIGDDYVIVHARPVHIETVKALGYRAESIILPAAFPPEYTEYHDYNGMMAEIQQAATAHPGITRLFSIGKSYDGRELWTMEISANPKLDEGEPASYFMGLHHAREHLTLEMTLAIMNHLTDNYNVDDRVTDIVNNRETFITFNLNPDGGEYDTINDTFQWWRKNRQPNPGSEYVGTDLNRNYGYAWGATGGSSPDPSSEIYRGQSPFSAPETAAVRTFVNNYSNIKTSITFHTFSELVMWPYSYTYTAVPPDMDPADHGKFVEMANYMASSNGYTAQQASELYISDGDCTDWMYGEHRIFAFTIEMYPKDDDPMEFYPPGSCIKEQCTRNMEAVLYTCENAGGPMPPPAPLFIRLEPNSLVPGDRFTLSVGSRNAACQKCDIYFLCSSPYGVYTICPDGKIKPGIKPMCRNISLSAPGTFKMLDNAVVPDIKGDFTFILAAAEAGKIPNVRNLIELAHYAKYVLSYYTVMVTVLERS